MLRVPVPVFRFAPIFQPQHHQPQKMVVRGGGGCGGSVGGGAAVRARVGRSRARLRLGVVG